MALSKPLHDARQLIQDMSYEVARFDHDALTGRFRLFEKGTWLFGAVCVAGAIKSLSEKDYDSTVGWFAFLPPTVYSGYELRQAYQEVEAEDDGSEPSATDPDSASLTP